jgi:hypothetical protein
VTQCHAQTYDDDGPVNTVFMTEDAVYAQKAQIFLNYSSKFTTAYSLTFVPFEDLKKLPIYLHKVHTG